MENWTVIKTQLINGIIPKRAHSTDAGADLYSIETLILKPGEVLRTDIGIALEIPEGYYGQIADRSSMALKGIKVLGGVIDSSYRNNISVCLINLTNAEQTVAKGDRIAQIILIPCLNGVFAEGELSETERGHGGFGSTGR